MEQPETQTLSMPFVSLNLQKIGVLGAGLMGAGVAQTLAQAGFEVVLIDVSRKILDDARSRIIQGLRLQTLLNKGAMALSPQDALRRIGLSEDIMYLNSADFVIENVTERWEIKRDLYAQIEEICASTCIFAANTSAIPIAQIASATKRAARVIGIHFMNPVPMKKTVEVIRGSATSDETVKTTKHLLEAIGKECVVVNDAPGFVSNRVLMLMINEAITLVQENVAAPEAVDKIFRDCFGHKMGPLETADLIGLDTILLSLEVLHENFRDDKFLPCSLLKEMVAAGTLGRKRERGFYDYASSTTPTDTWAGAAQ